MLSKTKIILLIISFSYSTKANTVVCKTNYSDSFYNYLIVGIKEDSKNFKFLVRITHVKYESIDNFDNFKTTFMLNKEKMKVSTNGQNFISSTDVVLEDLIHSIRLVYIFNDINFEEIKKISFNNKEINITL